MSLYFIHVHKVFIWIARSVEIFCRKCQHQFNYVLIKIVYLFFQAEKDNKGGKLVRVDQQKMQNKLNKTLLCEINNGQSVDLYSVFAT